MSCRTKVSHHTSINGAAQPSRLSQLNCPAFITKPCTNTLASLHMLLSSGLPVFNVRQATTPRFDTTALLATYGWLSSKATSAALHIQGCILSIVLNALDFWPSLECLPMPLAPADLAWTRFCVLA
mmetsp:Transcript_151407/g.384872  ORF Transcript_151407/g.384872 Transcript_151407/m.384872 type:complete len:126 (-) Transcript_151407:637-1014(-)